VNLEPPKNIVKTQAPRDAAASERAKPAAPKVTAAPESPDAKPAETNGGAVVTVQPMGTPPPPPADSEASSSATNVPPVASLVGEADIATLKLKNLLIPVQGVTTKQLRDTFYDGRSEGRQHQALDIMAAGGTPVLAAADGKVAKLFQSEKGGITLYQLDSSGLYYYYYAHLQSYAGGIVEGKELKRGDVIAYVGDTGNAGAGNFHLHFGINKPTAPGKWGRGEAINPYPLLANR
jgi:murein DD-endopeptidase MepM/ murein hydrolase activator NlpD